MSKNAREQMQNAITALLHPDQSGSMVNAFNPAPYAIPASEHSVMREWEKRGGTTFDADTFFGRLNKDAAHTICVVTDGDSDLDLSGLDFDGVVIVRRDSTPSK